MARLLVLYHAPKDGAAFDRYYTSTHIPIAKKIPGLRKYDVSTGGVATLYFDSVADIQNAFASPEGQAAAADLANFADGGADMYILDTVEV